MFEIVNQEKPDEQELTYKKPEIIWTSHSDFLNGLIVGQIIEWPWGVLFYFCLLDHIKDQFSMNDQAIKETLEWGLMV